jgi:23S rRNA (guanosine2251-2'-O)-methyltransferase
VRNRGRRRFDSGQKFPPSAGRERPSPHHRARNGGPRHPRRENAGEIIFGIEPIRELISASPAVIATLFVKAGAYERFGSEIETVRAAGGRVVQATDADLARMAGAESRHQGLVAALREYPYVPLEALLELKPDPLPIVDGVTDPRNLGAIMRAAECAGTSGLVLARDRTAGITPAAVKASSGAWAHLKVARCGNVAQTLEALKAEGYWIVALAPEGDTSLYELDAGRRLAIVLGAEDHGVRTIVKHNADFVVRIPMRGRVASLNVAVAAAITLFELARRRDQNQTLSQTSELHDERAE